VAEQGYGLGKHNEFLKYTSEHKDQVKAVFIGASITEYWQQEGKQYWNGFAAKGAVNYGIGGDQTTGVLWRIQNKELDGLHPKVIVVGSGPGMSHEYTNQANIRFYIVSK
jgi:hypothetical protein